MKSPTLRTELRRGDPHGRGGWWNRSKLNIEEYSRAQFGKNSRGCENRLQRLLGKSDISETELPLPDRARTWPIVHCTTAAVTVALVDTIERTGSESARVDIHSR
jgi:hypothetical protein